MHSCRLFLALLLAALPPLLATAAPSAPSGTYLRIANLLPIQTPLVDLYRGADRYLAGMRSGFFQSYLPVPDTGGNQFTVKQNAAPIGTFTIPRKSGAQFYTLVIYQKNPGSPATLTLHNDEVPPIAPTAEAPTPPPPRPRLRLYVGAYDFPLTVSAEGVGTWPVAKTAFFLDQEITGLPPKDVKLTFVNRYNESVTVFFPTDYSSSLSYSAFISQRGVKRPRVTAFADNTEPEDDPQAAADVPSPGPSPSP